MNILEFNYEWRCILVTIDWAVIILYDFNKDLGSKKTLSLITFFSAICNFQLFFKFYVVVLTFLFLDWPEHVDVYAIGVVNCVTGIGEVGGRASNASLWIRLGYPSPLLRFLHHTVPFFSLLPVFSPFSITRFSLQTPPSILRLSGYFESIMAPEVLLSQALQKWPHH